MTNLYPELDHRETHFLDVAGGHTICVHEAGNPDGKPAVVLHGGPGGGSSPRHYRFFDPDVYRIVIFDQRGCGQSTPYASVEHNTTWDLVSDIEAIRELLGIDRWLVFGGSWGSALAMAYAQSHPERVSEMVLRGIFMLRPSELAFFYQDGASHLFPDAWEGFLAPIPLEERDDLIAAYHRRLFGEDRDELLRCAAAWSEWERATCMLDPEAAGAEPPEQAEAELVVNTRAGHSMFDPENAAALVDACDRFRHL